MNNILEFNFLRKDNTFYIFLINTVIWLNKIEKSKIQNLKNYEYT